jgi:hypothetical protein
VIHNGTQHEAQSKTTLLHPGGDANEEAEDEDTAMDTETPVEPVDGGAETDVTMEQASEGTSEPGKEAAEAVPEAAEGDLDASKGGDAPPDLDKLALERKQMEEGGEATEVQELKKEKKKKEPRFPHWYSLRA